MHFRNQSKIIVLIGSLISTCYAGNLPPNFVYLQDIDPSIIQDIRYSTAYNFVGKSIKGYQAAKCVLTQPAAEALSQVQKELLASSLSLKVYDCYRPQMAVDEFIVWSKNPTAQQMKNEFYPRVDKAKVFDLGYVSKQSGHTRGSTVDLTIVSLRSSSKLNFANQSATCIAPYLQRFNDGEIDMGTNFDCMDELSHNDNQNISIVAYQNRLILKNLMEKYGFSAYQPEWWHFTLKNEPYQNIYFNFIIQ